MQLEEMQKFLNDCGAEGFRLSKVVHNEKGVGSFLVFCERASDDSPGKLDKPGKPDKPESCCDKPEVFSCNNISMSAHWVTCMSCNKSSPRFPMQTAAYEWWFKYQGREHRKGL
jgi:hypothetical protein